MQYLRDVSEMSYGTMAIMQIRLQQDSWNSSRIVRITATPKFLDVIFVNLTENLSFPVGGFGAPLSDAQQGSADFEQRYDEFRPKANFRSKTDFRWKGRVEVKGQRVDILLVPVNPGLVWAEATVGVAVGGKGGF